MARALLDRELKSSAAAARSRIRFALASERDDSAIRRLLRDNPARGEISLTFEREPNYFRGTGIGGARDETILAFEGDRLVCLGRCSTRCRYLNGAVRRVAYLSELRLDAGAQGRFDILRRGYQFFRELHREHPPDFYFTSIASDNERSARFLERNLPGMPAYRLLADYVTFLVAVPRYRRGPKRRGVSNQPLAEMTRWLNEQGQQYQLASAWTESELQSLANHGMGEAMCVVRAGKVLAAGALWDQRGFRQTVIREYGARLSLARPWLNLAAPLFGSPRLPAVGTVLAHAFLSPLAAASDEPEALIAMVEASLAEAADRGLDFVTLGFDANDPRAATIRAAFRARKYFSRFYSVTWPDRPSEPFGGGCCCPETAWL